MTVKAILEEAKKLDHDQLVQLRDELNALVSAEDDYKETPEQIAELIRRQKEHKKNPHEGLSWEVLKAEVD